MPDLTGKLDWIAGEPMVCEEHFWRLWPAGDDEGCPGPGMPLSGAEGYDKQMDKLKGERGAAIERANNHLGDLSDAQERLGEALERERRLKKMLEDFAAQYGFTVHWKEVPHAD